MLAASTTASNGRYSSRRCPRAASDQANKDAAKSASIRPYPRASYEYGNASVRHGSNNAVAATVAFDRRLTIANTIRPVAQKLAIAGRRVTIGPTPNITLIP